MHCAVGRGEWGCQEGGADAGGCCRGPCRQVHQADPGEKTGHTEGCTCHTDPLHGLLWRTCFLDHALAGINVRFLNRHSTWRNLKAELSLQADQQQAGHAAAAGDGGNADTDASGRPRVEVGCLEEVLVSGLKNLVSNVKYECACCDRCAFWQRHFSRLTRCIAASSQTRCGQASRACSLRNLLTVDGSATNLYHLSPP